jgi:hypothetical protein
MRYGVGDKWEQADGCEETPLVLQGADCVHVYIGRRAKLLVQVHSAISALFQNPTRDRLERLISAKLEFERKRIESYRILEDLKIYLDQLIVAILEAVVHITDKKPCEKLLAHAAFAKYQLPKFNHNEFANTVRDLQVLNTLRSVEYGWLITGGAFLDLLRDDKARLVSNVIQLQNTITNSSSALELASVLCHLYGVNPSIVAENWAVRMLKKHTGSAVEGVLRKIKPYDSIDYVRLATAAKKYSIIDADVYRIVKGARDPKVRMIYILTELKRDAEAMQDVLESMDGNAIVTYLALCRYQLPKEVMGRRLIDNPLIADQYAAFREYRQYNSVLQIEGYRPLRAAAIEMLHNSDQPFGKDGPKLGEVVRRLAATEKNSPLALAVSNQQKLIGKMQAMIQHESPGAGFSPTPSKSPRFILAQLLYDRRTDAVAAIKDTYKISDKTLAWIQIQTFSQRKDWARFVELSKKTQPLPWDVYAEVCHANDRREEAITFIRKISSAEQRMALFEQYEYWSEAAGAASEIKSPRWAEFNAKAKAAGEE